MKVTEPNSLLIRIDQAFSVSPHLCGRQLVIETDADTVVVRGTVETYYQKQMAQEIMRRVEGVQKIDNQLEVAWG